MCATLDAQPAAARTTGFGTVATQTCLKNRGATFGSASDPAIAALPAKQRVKVLAGVLPPGTALLYLVIGSDGADAVSLRNQLATQVEFRPTPANPTELNRIVTEVLASSDTVTEITSRTSV